MLSSFECVIFLCRYFVQTSWRFNAGSARLDSGLGRCFLTMLQRFVSEIRLSIYVFQLATKALTSTSEEELGNRVRALTENLIQKQTLIEALSTEKNSLVLQLERLEV